MRRVAMSIRALHRSEIDRAAELLQRMVTEIAALGGPPTKGKAEVERWFSDRIRETSDDPDHLWLVAVSDGPAYDLIGLLEAAVTVPSQIFLPTSSLHIHAVYVDPDHRRMGVARSPLSSGVDVSVLAFLRIDLLHVTEKQSTLRTCY
jgi:GNAT superfamily N-acetyltransferase